MIRGLYTAVSGMITLEAKQDVITNNIANANTNGYKVDNLSIKSFKDVLIENKDKVLAGQNVSNSIGRLSLGAAINGTNVDYSQGVLQDTGKDTDFAIEGKGFLVVQRNNKNYYTRDGHFRINSQGYLVTDIGDQVMGTDSTGKMGPIFIGNGKLSLDVNNNILVDGKNVSKLATADFNDYNSLKKVGDNLYEGENPDYNGKVYVKQKALEKSNVNIITEMVNMMTVSRSFETNQKMIQTIDETMAKAANEVGAVR